MSKAFPSIAYTGSAAKGWENAERLRREHGYVVVSFDDPARRFCATAFWLDHGLFWRDKVKGEPLSTPLTDLVRQTRSYLRTQIGTALLNEMFHYDAKVTSPEQVSARLMDQITSRAADIRRAEDLIAPTLAWGEEIMPDVWLRHMEKAASAISSGVLYLPYDGPLTKIRTRVEPMPLVIPHCRHKVEEDFAKNVIGATIRTAE